MPLEPSLFSAAPNITLLTSHFALRDPTKASHYSEIEAAMRANLLNPALAEMVVVYEPLPNDGCADLRERLLASWFLENLQAHRSLLPTVTCYTWEGPQPSYLDMLRFAETPPAPSASPAYQGGQGRRFDAETIVLANADVVFDYTLDRLPQLLRRGTDVFVLSVNAPPNATLVVAAVTNTSAHQVGVLALGNISHQAWFQGQCPAPVDHMSWFGLTHSWDAFVFQ